MKFIQFVVIGLCISVSFISPTTVKMELSVAHKQMTLTCLVQNRDSNLNIFLLCPFSEICKENCKSSCGFSTSEENCMSDKMIRCKDKGVNENTGFYEIEYIIDGADRRNNGKWKCSYAKFSSSIISVDVPLPEFPSTSMSIFTNMTKSSKPTVNKQVPRATPVDLVKSSNTEMQIPLEYSKLLTKSEFILSVIGLLAVSLIFNIFFCFRLLFIKCKLKKTTYDNGDYFSMQQNQRPFNRCNSQTSDPERIYEDTSATVRQMSFLTKIKNSNGNYVGQSSLSPSSGHPTLLPPNYLPLNHSLSFPLSTSDNGNHLISTPTQIYYPLPTDPNQTNYGAIGIHSNNQYTNFLSVQPELGNRDPNNQPLYLAFTPGHPIISTNSRYLQYSNQPLPISNESVNSNDAKPSPTPSHVKNGFVTRSISSDQDNYQRSRDIMEEADSLLLTADTLLKSTQKDMEMIQ